MYNVISLEIADETKEKGYEISEGWRIELPHTAKTGLCRLPAEGCCLFAGGGPFGFAQGRSAPHFRAIYFQGFAGILRKSQILV